MKDKQGNKVTLREFFRRWKKGMEGINPLQQARITQWGMNITIFGIFWGIIFAAFVKMWWLMTILIGALVINSMAYLGNWQKKRVLQDIENIIKEQDIQVNKQEENKMDDTEQVQEEKPEEKKEETEKKEE